MNVGNVSVLAINCKNLEEILCLTVFLPLKEVEGSKVGVQALT